MSRHLAVLKQMDIIKDEGKLTLTDHGKELEKRYEEESVLLQKWFLVCHTWNIQDDHHFSF